MNCSKNDLQKYIYGEGLADEIKLTAYEAKTPDQPLKDRALAAAKLPDTEENRRKAAKIYEDFRKLPITSERTQDPTEPEKIVSWCPLLLSPYDYTLPADIEDRKNAALAAMRSQKCTKVFDTAYAFATAHDDDFAPADAAAWLAEHKDSRSCAQTIAVDNIAAGIPVGEAGVYMNPLRMSSGAMQLGAAFGVRFSGAPEKAAKAAMLYALTGYYKGGVYAAMWTAAMLAHAAVISDPEVYTVRSLSCTPIPTPYFKGVSWMQRNLNCLVKREDCLVEIGKHCDASDELILHSAYPNSMAVAAALLYCGNDVENALDSVEKAGFEKGKNRALVLAVLGMVNGSEAIKKYLA